MGYRFLGHTADIIIEGTGSNLAEAIEQTALGLIERMGKAKKQKVTFQIEEKAETLDELVVHSLSSILTECDIHELQPHSFKITEFDSKGEQKLLKAKLSMGRGKAKDSVKAVTYHNLKVEEKDEEAVVQVLLDI